MMRVGIDAWFLACEKCGVVNYLCKLVFEMARLEPGCEIYLFSPREFLAEHRPFLEHPRVHCVALGLSRNDEQGWPVRHLPRLLKEYRIDLFHQPFNADGALFSPRVPTVITIHDMIPWILPGYFRSWAKATRYKFRNLVWTRRADHLLTVSENTKRDVMRCSWLAGEKITVTHLGSDGIFGGVITDEERKDILSAHRLAGKRYIVNVGGLNQRRRNPLLVVEAFAEMLRRSRQDVSLVFTGNVVNHEGMAGQVTRKIEALGIKDRVVSTGFLSDKELKVVVSGAEVCLVTSLYEGFCLPVMESFACGVPVIANDRGSVPEVAGDAAILLAPHDQEGLVDALNRVLTNPDERRSMIDRGLKRAAQFSWKKMAQITLRAYQSVLAGKKP